MIWNSARGCYAENPMNRTAISDGRKHMAIMTNGSSSKLALIQPSFKPGGIGNPTGKNGNQSSLNNSTNSSIDTCTNNKATTMSFESNYKLATTQTSFKPCVIQNSTESNGNQTLLNNSTSTSIGMPTNKTIMTVGKSTVGVLVAPSKL